MNSFDIAVLLGLAIAVGTGFSTGLIRSAITILAYIVAMPITVWVMSFVPPLTANANSPLMQNAGFFLGAFLVIGMVIGKLARIPVDEAIGTDIGLVDRLSGAGRRDTHSQRDATKHQQTEQAKTEHVALLAGGQSSYDLSADYPLRYSHSISENAAVALRAL